VGGEILDKEILIGFLNFRISNFGISEYNIIFFPEYLKSFCAEKKHQFIASDRIHMRLPIDVKRRLFTYCCVYYLL
jgi:hypothetical protein